MTFIILHHTAADTPGSTINGFLDSAITANPKSAHYLVDIDGHVIKTVNESMRTPHAGLCSWYGLETKVSPPQFNWNDVSVGIEQVHAGTIDYPNELIAGTKNLIQRIRAAYGTSRHNVLGHGEIAIHDPTKQKTKKLGRKLFCPGEQYNWPFLENSGNATKPISVSQVVVPHDRYGAFFVAFPGESINTIEINDRTKARNIQSILPLAIQGLQQTLAELGYFVNSSARYDEPTVRAVEAFQVRYFSGETRKGERRQIMQGNTRLANLVTISRMHEVLAVRGTFKF
jgi:N-acetyl-anhydromuramyl-L-alanine amidase AmpD